MTASEKQVLRRVKHVQKVQSISLWEFFEMAKT